MPQYDFQCEKCKTVYEKTFRMVEKPESVPCEKCDGTCVAIIYVPAINIDNLPSALPHVMCPNKENNDPISARNSTYWRNAEAVRKREVAKKHRVEQEKYFYKDKETVRKVNARKRAQGG